MVISINGMDNSGKSIQAKRLTELYPDIFIARLHINNMQTFKKEEFNFDWWFSPDNGLDFTRKIYTCLNERIECAKRLNTDSKVIIFDKGFDFYETRILATLISKGYTLEQSKSIQSMIRSEFDFEDVEDIKFYLLPGSYVKDEELAVNRKQLYNSYLQLNKLLLKLSDIDYEYIKPDKLEFVTNNILEITNKRMEEKNAKRYIKKSS